MRRDPCSALVERRHAKASWVALVPVSLAVVVFLWDVWGVKGQIDDAYISFRYARNLVDGVGLVYNAGERVEGMTNLLWTLLVAAGMAAGLPAQVVAHGLGVASGVGVLVAAAALAREGLPAGRAWLAGLAPWLVLASPALTRWSESGLETSLFTLLSVGALLALLRGRMGWAALALLLATLARPDGALLAALVFGLHLLRHASSGMRGWASRSVWAPPLAWAAAMLAVTAFRLAYYGSPVPNTFYAKVSGVDLRFGLLNLGRFLGGGMLLQTLVAAAGLVVAPRLRPLALYCAAMMVYVVAIGGDVLGHTRFLLPLLPCLAALSLAALAIAWERRPGAAIALAAVLALGVGWNVAGEPLPGVAAAIGLAVVAAARAAEPHWPRWLAATAGTAVAACALGSAVERAAPPPRPAGRFARLEHVRKLDRFFADNASRTARFLTSREPRPRLVAAVGIGALGYASRLPILDLVGLVDAEIARSGSGPGGAGLAVPGHQRSNAEYVLQRSPDWLVIKRKGSPSVVRAVVELWQRPEFDERYVWDSEHRVYRARSLPALR